MYLFSTVNEGVSTQNAFLSKRLVTLCTLVWFLPGMNKGVHLQAGISAEGFVALGAPGDDVFRI